MTITHHSVRRARWTLGVLAFVLAARVAHAQTWYSGSWTYRKAITIDFTKVGTGPHTNFPVLISITDANLQSNALASGNDILFTSSDGTTKLDHEIESYTSGTGALVAWVRVPSLSSSANTMLHMYYGNAGAANQQNVNATWNANFKGVWHLNGAFTDATSNANNGTNTGTSSATGKIAGGRGFVRSNGADYITISGKMGSPANVTLSAWTFLATADAQGGGVVGIGDYIGLNMDKPSLGTEGYFYSGGGWYPASNNTFWGGVWRYLTYTFDDAGNSQRLYINGVQITSTALSQSITYTGLGPNTIIGKHSYNDVGYDFDGTIDEVRIADTPRSAGWILTEYNNQNAPSTFASVGSQVAAYTISGNVFEDKNYGGGAGRSKATASGVGRSAARVELYTSAGVYSTFATTDVNGDYAFTGLSAGTYYVRVVNSSVTSARTGYTSAAFAVQTYRTTAASGSAVAVTDYVGGTTPSAVDPGNGSSGATFNTSTLVYSAVLSGTAQSVTQAVVSSANISGVDFGFNFNSVVNINSGGQGSLRQFIDNANLFSDDAGLVQSGLVAAKDNAVFMISNGTAAAGLRSANNSFSSGVATIVPTSGLSTITTPMVLDAQKQPGWSALPIVELNGTSAGASKGLYVTGGGTVIRGFVVNRFNGTGVELTTAGSDTVQGNHIGTNAAGTAASTNSNMGLYAGGVTNLLIGGTTATTRNVISGNTSVGLYFNNVDNSTVSGNYIGTDVNGTADVNGSTSNTAQSGIVLYGGSSGNTVGGTTANARNIISGNNHYGFEVQSSTSQNNLVIGNYIGTTVTGLTALPNVNGGVSFWGAGSGGTGSTVGGTTASARNVIAGNTGIGVLVGNASNGSIVQGNYIGVGSDGTTAVGNSLQGVSVEGASTTTSVGGTAAGAGNVIANNGSSAIAVSAANTIGAAILGNSIFANATTSIDLLADGVTANDGAKTAGQPNLLMDKPVFTAMSLSGTTLTIAGYVGSAAGQSTFATARVELFKSDNDASGFGEGQTYLGFLTSDASGNLSGTLTASGLSVGDKVTGTATDGSNNTSEFGANATVVSVTTITTGTEPSNASIGPGGAATMADAFTLQTGTGTDVITAMTVTLASGTSGGLASVDITNDAGTVVYGTITNPGSDTPVISLTTNITATTTLTQYKIRVTPKSHANMPAPTGSTYAVTARISAWTGTNAQSGSDAAGTTVTIDNLSPSNVSGGAAVAGNTQVSLTWANPGDSDLHSTVVLRRTTSVVTDTPVEGTIYTVGSTIGSSTVACVTTSTTCTDTGLSNGTAYYYKVFARDANGNYATGTTPSASPATPQPTIAGTVYEDVHYGGGAGRSKATSSGVGRSNARVELYTSAGAYSAFSTTDANGDYTFTGVSAGTYYVRVVNASVTSSRTGYTSSALAVQTHRTDATSGSAVAVTDHVGGTTPSLVDPGNGSSGATFNTTTYVYSAVLSGTAQSVTRVVLGSSGISGIDFGFNFNSVVNVNNAGQGSLRQFQTNATLLTGDGSMAQAGLVAAKDNAVFMISNGTVAAGLRSANNYLSGGIASITLTAAYSWVTSVMVMDARKQPGYAGTPLLELNGSGAGAGADGFRLDAGSSTVAGFIINRFSGNGVYSSSAGGNTIAGNYIGTNAAGGAASANGGYGVLVANNSNNTIGGLAANDRNVISGNTSAGVYIGGSGTSYNVVQGNYIGTSASGGVAVPNASGIILGDGVDHTTIGGTTAAARNVIAGNTGSGVSMAGSNNNTSVIQGNYVGVGSDGTTAMGNGGSGVLAQSGLAGASIGGTTATTGNVIANNGGPAVTVKDAGTIGVSILGNAIYGNTGTSIDLSANGITANDGAKTAGQPNLLMDKPVITSASLTGTTLAIGGYVGSAAGQSTFASARIELFKSDNDVSGFGEGQSYLGFLTTDASGNLSGSITVSGLVAGDKVTATATDGSGNTSEYGTNVTVITPTPLLTLATASTPAGTVVPGTDVAFSTTFTNAGSANAQGVVLADPIPANTDFKLGSVTTTLGTTGLTATVAYSNTNGSTWTYTPVSAGGGAPAGYDRLVTNIRWTFTGSLSSTAPNNTGSVAATVRIR